MLRENEKKRRAKNECLARQREKRDILQMNGGEQKGRWGHTCDPLKSNPPLFFFFFFFGWGITFPLYKYFLTLSYFNTLIIPSHSLIHNSLSLPNSFISRAPKSQKSSYVLSDDVFNLTCWNGAVRLNKPPSLIHGIMQNQRMQGSDW